MKEGFDPLGTAMMTYFVYFIISKVKKTISYVGYTNNLERRLKLNNTNKGAKFTKGKKWKLAYYETFKSKKEAMKKEYVLKNYKLRNKLKAII